MQIVVEAFQKPDDQVDGGLSPLSCSLTISINPVRKVKHTEYCVCALWCEFTETISK